MRIVRLALAVSAALLAGAAVAGPAAAYPAGVQGEAMINATVFAPGGTATVNVTHTTPGALTMEIFSAPVIIGRGTTGANGSGSVSGVIPAGYSGQHTIQVVAAGGEIFTFQIVVTGGGGGGGTTINCGGGLASTNPADPQTDRHTVKYGNSCTGPSGTRITCTLTLGSWTASETETISNLATTGVTPKADPVQGSAQFSGPFTDLDHLLPLGNSTVAVVFTTDTGTVVGRDAVNIDVVAAPTSAPPTGSTSGAAPTATSTTSTGTGTGRNGGTLASTGAQVGLGVGAGVLALLVGGLVLVAGRRRSPRYGN